MYVSITISKSAPVSDLKFGLDQVKGKVLLSKKVKILAQHTMIIKGQTQVTGHQKCVHVLVEPSPKCTSVFVLGNTSELRLGSLGVTVVLRKLREKDVTLNHTLRLAQSLLPT